MERKSNGKVSALINGLCVGAAFFVTLYLTSDYGDAIAVALLVLFALLSAQDLLKW